MHKVKTKNIFDVSKDVVVITGVSGGLGSIYARAFLEAGSKVVGLDITKSIALQKIIDQYPENFLFQLTDVTDKSALQDSLQVTLKKFNKVTVLINNAAIDSPPSADQSENGPFESYSEESWNKVLDVNLKSVFLCCQVFGGYMASQKQGSVINISSIYGLVSPDQSIYSYRRKDDNESFFKPVAYSASKSGVLNLTRYLATYWAHSNVRVNSLTLAGVFNDQDDEFLAAYCQRIPMGRMADSSDYNGAVLFLSSQASSYMTGSNLIIDGGWTAI